MRRRAALLDVFSDPSSVVYDLGGGDGFEELGAVPQQILGHGSVPPGGVAAGGDGMEPGVAGGMPPTTVAKLDLETLPIHEHRGRILSYIDNNQVTCIQGETGCGKSSMVPQVCVLRESVCAFLRACLCSCW